MSKKAVLQDNWTSGTDPNSLCSFDYEAIEKPTKALMHRAARFLYFNKGRGKIKIDGTEYEIIPDTLCVITPWKVTDIIDVRDTLHLNLIIYDYQYINTILKVSPGLEKESENLLEFLAVHPVVYLKGEQREEVRSLMAALRKELGVESSVMQKSEKPLSFLYALTKMVELMVLYRRFFQSSNVTSLASMSGPQNAVLSYIFFHSAEHLTMEKVADVFYISASTLSKRLSDLTGTTFSRLLVDIRVDKAVDYLIYTGLPLDEIAVLIGFTDASHLTRHFVEKFGLTPNKYRKTYGKGSATFSASDKNIGMEVTEYLYDHFDSELLHASQFAEKYQVSVSELNRILLYYAGKNFATLLNYIRINKAGEMLVTTTYSILEISISVGYSNIKTFNLNFFKFKGMTPSEFRDSVTLQKLDKTVSGTRSC